MVGGDHGGSRRKRFVCFCLRGQRRAYGSIEGEVLEALASTGEVGLIAQADGSIADLTVGLMAAGWKFLD